MATMVAGKTADMSRFRSRIPSARNHRRLENRTVSGFSRSSFTDTLCIKDNVLLEGKLIDIQNLIFRYMPKKVFADAGVSKQDMIQLSHSMRSLDFTSELKKVSCPVAIVCGEKDNVNQKAARQLSILLPQAELHIIPGAGHEINKDVPEAIADILKL